MSFVERDLDVRTAEAVAVRFELAGLGSRFLALAADLALQLLVVLAVFIVLMLYTTIVVNHSPFAVLAGIPVVIHLLTRRARTRAELPTVRFLRKTVAQQSKLWKWRI